MAPWAAMGVACLLWGVTGMIAVPLALVLWGDLSGTGQDLGSIVLVYVGAGAGLAAGAVAGAVVGGTPAAGPSLVWGRRMLLGVAAVALLYAAIVAL